MNKAVLIGRLTKDPEIKFTQNEKAYTNFTIAVNRPFEKGKADFINIVAWNKLAEFINRYFSKGRQIAIVGRLQIRDYEKDGKTIYITEVIADECYFADSKKELEINYTEEENDLPF